MDLQVIEEKILGREWFYEFQLTSSGRRTKSYLPNAIQLIHRTRERMMFDYLEQAVRTGRQSKIPVDNSGKIVLSELGRPSLGG